MYQRNGCRVSIGWLIVLGFIIGLGFFLWDNFRANPDAPIELATLSSFETANAAPITTETSPEDDIDYAATQELYAEVTPQTPITFQQTSSHGLPTIPRGSHLFIPSAGIYTPIVQAFLDGTSWDVSGLGENAGHLQGTPWISDPGNVVLSGHVEMADGRLGVFANLSVLKIDDLIVITDENGVENVYVVRRIWNTRPDDLSPLYSEEKDTLTLITCDEYNFLENSYLERTIIRAERLG